jgi:hypothetical protein
VRRRLERRWQSPRMILGFGSQCQARAGCGAGRMNRVRLWCCQRCGRRGHATSLSAAGVPHAEPCGRATLDPHGPSRTRIGWISPRSTRIDTVFGPPLANEVYRWARLRQGGQARRCVADSRRQRAMRTS